MPRYRYVSDVARALFHRMRRQGEEMDLSEAQAAQVEAIAPGALVRADRKPEPEPEADLEIEEVSAAVEPEEEALTEPVPVPDEIEAPVELLAANAICEREALHSKRFAGSEPVVTLREEPPARIYTRPARRRK